MDLDALMELQLEDIRYNANLRQNQKRVQVCGISLIVLALALAVCFGSQVKTEIAETIHRTVTLHRAAGESRSRAWRSDESLRAGARHPSVAAETRAAG